MKCANRCGQQIRETEPRDGIEMHDGEYEFRWVHEDGNPVCDGMFTATPLRSANADPAPVVRTLRDLGQRPAEVMGEVEDRKPVFITRHGRFIAVIVPLRPGQAEAQVTRALVQQIIEGS